MTTHEQIGQYHLFRPIYTHGEQATGWRVFIQRSDGVEQIAEFEYEHDARLFCEAATARDEQQFKVQP